MILDLVSSQPVQLSPAIELQRTWSETFANKPSLQ